MRPFTRRIRRQRLGSVQLAARFLAAAPDCGAGGDFYDVVSTPYGVRAIIGDVSGHGAGACELAADFAAASHDLIRNEPTLAGAAGRLDNYLAVRAPEHTEEFVTALFLQIPDRGGGADLVCCGHPAPLLVRRNRVMSLDPIPRDLPLGLFGLVPGMPTTAWIPFESGDHLLLYTDGIDEARDRAGRFFPLADRVAELLPACRTGDDLLARLAAEVQLHSGGHLQDDIALVYMRRDPPSPTEQTTGKPVDRAAPRSGGHDR